MPVLVLRLVASLGLSFASPVPTLEYALVYSLGTSRDCVAPQILTCLLSGAVRPACTFSGVRLYTKG